jgi:hypothetical protein
MTTQQTETQWTWWTPPVNRPAYILHTDGGKIEEGISIPDDFVICDICNATISLRPVPLLYTSYATCPVCFQRDTSISVEEAAILDGIELTEIEVVEEVQL